MSNLMSHLNNTPLVQQLKSHAKALALSSAMILSIEQVAAQAAGTPHVDIMKDTVTGELVFAFKEQPGYEINLNGSGTQTGFGLYGPGGIQWAGADGPGIGSAGMSNPTALNTIITDNDNIGVDSRAYKLDSLPDGDYHINFTGQTPSGVNGIGIGFSLVNGKIQINFLEDNAGTQQPVLRDNRPQIGTPTLSPSNNAIQVPVSAVAPTSITSANSSALTNAVSIVARQDNGFIIQDGSTVVANINAQLNLGAGGTSSVQLNVPLGCNVTIDSIKTSHGYNTAGNPNNTNIAWSGITGTGIGVTAVAGVGPILPNPNTPNINASTVTYSVPNIPAGFTPVGTLGGINGTWNSSTNEMTFVNVPVGNNNGTISLGGCSTTINATITNTEVAPFMGNVPDQIYTNGVAITNVDMSTYTTLTNGDPILSYNLSGTLPTGLVFNSSSGILSGTPTQNGTFNLSITATDNDGVSNSDNFSITVNAPTNNNPVANNDTYTTPEDNNIVLSPLTNDTDVDIADVLNISDINGTTLTGGAQNINVPSGTINISAGGTITFTPNLDYFGSVTFPYTINDGNGGTSSATITINITPVNDNPVANNDTYTTPEDNNIVLNPLTNDTDVDVADVLNISNINSTSITGGAQNINVTGGTIDISASGIITFIPNLNYNSPVTFPYTINDGNGGTATANITITVNAVNDAPTGNDTEYTLLRNTSQDFDVTSQTDDVDGPNATYTISTQPLHGTVVDNGAGQYTYTPDNNFVGEDSLYVTRADGGTPNESVIVKVKFIVDDDSGIEEINSLDINIYPNPTTEYLSITTPDNVPTVSYEIYDMNKRLVDMGEYSNGDHIDVSRFESGVYIIQCTDTSNSQHTAIQRFIKN